MWRIGVIVAQVLHKPPIKGVVVPGTELLGFVDMRERGCIIEEHERRHKPEVEGTTLLSNGVGVLESLRPDGWF